MLERLTTFVRFQSEEVIDGLVETKFGKEERSEFTGVRGATRMCSETVDEAKVNGTDERRSFEEPSGP